jgi:hypothetical protein
MTVIDRFGRYGFGGSDDRDHGKCDLVIFDAVFARQLPIATRAMCSIRGYDEVSVELGFGRSCWFDGVADRVQP